MKLTMMTAAACLAATTAFAGDWNGMYGGAYYSTADGEDYNFGSYWPISDGSFYGGFAGYRRDMGNIVYGAEVAISAAVDVAEDDWSNWLYNSFTDLKATIGYDLGQTLIYASGGYTLAELDGEGTLYDFAGVNAAIGADYMVTSQIFVGGEYTYRMLEEVTGNGWTGELESIQIRAGYRF